MYRPGKLPQWEWKDAKVSRNVPSDDYELVGFNDRDVKSLLHWFRTSKHSYNPTGGVTCVKLNFLGSGLEDRDVSKLFNALEANKLKGLVEVS